MKIIVKNDLQAEVEVFQNFLHHKEYPQHRNIIFSSFPELQQLLDVDGCDEKTVLIEFISKIREENKVNIEKSVKYVENEINNKGEQTLRILADLMDYEFKKEAPDFILIPTIFPMCPFNGNTFFFSIYGSLKGVIEYPKVLAVSAHEISHMIFLDILKTKNIKLHLKLNYFVKELIAPILVYQDDFKSCFEKMIVGNYNVLEIYFDDSGRIIKAFDYFYEMFSKYISEKKGFLLFLKDMVSMCRKIEAEIIEKRSFDNQYGIKIMSDPVLLEMFRRPIKLK
jgi:hypothetical protein